MCFKRLKTYLKMLVTDPNSPEGLRMRADKLLEKGFSPQNPQVSALVKQADLIEMEQRRRKK